jgi:sulfoxide reductase heme-binding subunit YedZ
MPHLKNAFFAAALLPLGRLLFLTYTDSLGANPIEFITRSTGTWALVFLCITLAMTPLRLITGSTYWIKMRRMFGLFCFFYASLHFAIWIFLDQSLDFRAMTHDVLKRPFITMGFLTWVLLLPLAITSNRWSMQKLGKRWTVLHKTIYILAITAIAHYWWHKAGKNDLQVVSIYAGTIFLLLLLRIPAIRSHLHAAKQSSGIESS